MRLREPKVPHEPSPAHDGWIFGGLLVLLAWVPMPWGSNPGWARELFAIAAAGLVLGRLWLLRRQRAPLPYLPQSARVALAIWAAWLGWVLLQLVPLPAALLGVLSPQSFAAHDALRRAGGAPLYTISLLPGATLQQMLLSAGLLGLFWLTLVCVAMRRRRQRWLLLLVLGSALGQALYAIVMTLSGTEYGFLGPKQHNVGYTTGTFVNQNHFASYLGLGLAAGIALVLADLRPRSWQSWRDALDGFTELALSPRFRVRVALVVIVIALVLTRSRMGNVAVFLAMGICGSLFVLLRHRKYFVVSLALFLSIFLIDVWIVSDRYGLERLAQRLEQTDLQEEGRAAAFADMAPLAYRYALTGSGLGTFAAAFSQVRSDHVRGWYDHAHNDHLEYLIETGVPGYLLLVALAGVVVWHFARLVLRRHDPVAAALGFAGAMTAVLVFIHGMADFVLQIPAIAATAVALYGAALSCSSVPTAARPGGAPMVESGQPV